MNPETIESWKNAVDTHITALDGLIEDRKLLKKHFEEHLSQFFEWDAIQYNRDFSRVTLIYDKDKGAVVKSDNLSNLGMDWIVRPSYNDLAYRIIKIDVYPFGLPKEDEYFMEED